MTRFPTPDNSKTATPDVVFIGDGGPGEWGGHDLVSLAAFLDDMDALGFATWITPRVVSVFVGRVD